MIPLCVCVCARARAYEFARNGCKFAKSSCFSVLVMMPQLLFILGSLCVSAQLSAVSGGSNYYYYCVKSDQEVVLPENDN